MWAPRPGRGDLEVEVGGDLGIGLADLADDRAADDPGALAERRRVHRLRVEAKDAGEVGLEGLVAGHALAEEVVDLGPELPPTFSAPLPLLAVVLALRQREEALAAVLGVGRAGVRCAPVAEAAVSGAGAGADPPLLGSRTSRRRRPWSPWSRPWAGARLGLVVDRSARVVVLLAETLRLLVAVARRDQVEVLRASGSSASAPGSPWRSCRGRRRCTRCRRRRGGR